MADLTRRNFATGHVVTADEMNDLVWTGTLVYDDAAARDTALSGLTVPVGVGVRLADTLELSIWDGTDWNVQSFPVGAFFDDETQTGLTFNSVVAAGLTNNGPGDDSSQFITWSGDNVYVVDGSLLARWPKGGGGGTAIYPTTSGQTTFGSFTWAFDYDLEIFRMYRNSNGWKRWDLPLDGPFPGSSSSASQPPGTFGFADDSSVYWRGADKQFAVRGLDGSTAGTRTLSDGPSDLAIPAGADAHKQGFMTGGRFYIITDSTGTIFRNGEEAIEESAGGFGAHSWDINNGDYLPDRHVMFLADRRADDGSLDKAAKGVRVLNNNYRGSDTPASDRGYRTYLYAI